MSVSKVEQDELQNGYTIIESTHAILGTGTTKVVAIKGGKHPKMRLLVKEINTIMNEGEGLSGDFSFSYNVLYNTSGPTFTVYHRSGVVAGETCAGAATHSIQPFAPKASTDIATFEADEDVILAPSTAHGGATASSLVVLKFEVVN